MYSETLLNTFTKIAHQLKKNKYNMVLSGNRVAFAFRRQ